MYTAFLWQEKNQENSSAQNLTFSKQKPDAALTRTLIMVLHAPYLFGSYCIPDIKIM